MDLLLLLKAYLIVGMVIEIALFVLLFKRGAITRVTIKQEQTKQRKKKKLQQEEKGDLENEERDTGN